MRRPPRIPILTAAVLLIAFFPSPVLAGSAAEIEPLSTPTPPSIRACSEISLEPSELPDAAVGEEYREVLTASGGRAPYRFEVTAGSLPDGLSLAPDGTLSGTPTTAGFEAFVITATDSSSPPCTGGDFFFIEVSAEGQPTILGFEATPEAIDVGQSVTLSWFSVDGVSASIDQGVGAVPLTGEVTVRPTVTTTYTLTVTGPPGTPPTTATARVIVGCEDPEVPQLLAPGDGATGVDPAFGLEWMDTRGAVTYDVYLDTSSPPTTLVETNVEEPFFFPSELLSNTRYFWRVVAKGNPSCSPPRERSSAVLSFTTGAGCESPGDFEGVEPADGATSVPSSTTLRWQPAAGATQYDVFLGADGALSEVATGLTATSTQVSGLASGTEYQWFVIAYTDCGLISITSFLSFRVAGTCTPPAAVTLISPPSGAREVSTGPTLTWAPASGAASYDLYLSDSPELSLYAWGITDTSVALSELPNGVTFYWQVRAVSGCDAGEAASPVASFTVTSQCAAPGRVPELSVPTDPVSIYQTYVVSWADAPGLDADGGYVVERSLSPSFEPLLDRQEQLEKLNTAASFTALQAGRLYHRVRAVAGCAEGVVGEPSETKVVDVKAGGPDVVVSVPPVAVFANLGEPVANLSTSFTVENLSAEPARVRLSQSTSGPAFFRILDAQGAPAELATLDPRVPKTFRIAFLNLASDRPATFEGLVSVSSTGAPLAVTPYASVSLRIGGTGAASAGLPPVFRQDGQATERVSFPGLLGSDTNRPPVTVEIVNPNAQPMEVAAEIGPEAWVLAEAGWNLSPIPPGDSRTVRLFTRRSHAPRGSALPRSTYFTVRVKGGSTARLLVEDQDATSLANGRMSRLAPGERSVVVPSVVNARSAIGNTFLSTVRLSNVGTSDIQALLYFTPRDADGFDASKVRQATVLVRANDVVTLYDPLARLFGLTPPVSGQLEVRAAADRLGALNVTSSVVAPARAGGGFGFQMPTALRGEGARAGRPHQVPGITIDTGFRTNLILAETTGTDGATLDVTLIDPSGEVLGARSVTVPRYGQRQFSLRELAAGRSVTAGRVELSVTSGGGSVLGVATVVDNTNDDTATYVGAPIGSSPAGARRHNRGQTSETAAAATTRLVVPAVVSGFLTFPGTNLPYTFQSQMGFVSGSSSSAQFQVRYQDNVTGVSTTRTVTVPARRTLEYRNVLEELFGIPKGARSEGPIFVEAPPNGTVYCKTYSQIEGGTLGDVLPVIEVPSEALTGGTSPKPIYLDGLEQSIDATRGTRSNLLLNEVSGRPVTVVVRLYEAGNRDAPVAEREIALEANQKIQLSSVFRGLGLDTNERRKDRTNVLCTVTARSGAGLASGVVTTIDNKTGDIRNSILTPNGGLPASGGSIGF